jgi:RNA polymerase sigma-70 factor (ECF subfamily)
MAEEVKWTELVKLAQQGHENCMDSLARGVKGRLCAYIYRVTLDYDLTQDLSQEVLLQMFKSLERLDDAEHFWPWLYRIAQSKIQQHYKEKQRKTSIRSSAVYQDFLSQRSDYHKDDTMRHLAQQELSRKVIFAMKHLKQQYRAVLSLRCFEQLSYSDIAVALQCSEVRARVLFFRAKQALKKQLSYQGLSKGVMLMCLGIFGKLTASAEAAASNVTIPAACTKVGFTAALLGSSSSTTGLVVLTAIIITLIGVGALPNIFNSQPAEPQITGRADVNSVHFTTQLQDSDPNTGGSLSKGAYEQWFFFPEGVDGPMFMRMQRWTPEQDEKLCSWLENGQANYYYHSGEKQVYINNCRVCWSSLKVCRLPTDTKEFTEFLSTVEGDLPALSENMRDEQTGLLLSSMDYRFINAPDFQTDYSYNTVSMEYFQYGWLGTIPIIDTRDKMHKRGWTYFRISGRLNDRNITGRGQIPFVYNAVKDHPAWLKLNIANEIKLIDCKDGAQLNITERNESKVYPPGTFFEGLPRPWMGLHTADSVRRDAARRLISFHSERLENDANEVVITICHKSQPDNINLVYLIDMENDIVENIQTEVSGRTTGILQFEYFQDIDQADKEFVEPVISSTSEIQQAGPDVPWLIQLAQGSL